jgi:hypothetical protein
MQRGVPKEEIMRVVEEELVVARDDPADVDGFLDGWVAPRHQL